MKITVYGYWLRQALDYKSSIKFNWTWWLEPRVQLDILSSYKRQPFKSLSRSLWLRYLVQSTSLRRPCFEATYKCAIVKVGWSHHRKPNLLSEALCNLWFKWISKTNFSLEQIGLCLKKSLFAWLWIPPPPSHTPPKAAKQTHLTLQLWRQGEKIKLSNVFSSDLNGPTCHVINFLWYRAAVAAKEMDDWTLVPRVLSSNPYGNQTLSF